MAIAKTKPLTPSGAAAFLAYVKADMEGGEREWQDIALDAIIATLKS
jgi:hypothetical protein